MKRCVLHTMLVLYVLPSSIGLFQKLERQKPLAPMFWLVPYELATFFDLYMSLFPKKVKSANSCDKYNVQGLKFL